MSEMNNNVILRKIYNNLKNGGYYGYMFTGVRYPFFNRVIQIDNEGKYILWQNAGSSANKFTLEDLEFVIRIIFGNTPEEFVKRFELRQNNVDYMDEIKFPENGM